MVAFDHAYHGRTNLTMALTAKSMPYKSGFGPFAGEIYRAPMSYPYRDGLSGAGGRQARRAARSRSRSAPTTSPRSSSSRSRARAASSSPPRASWPRSLAGATANGVVFIADEIQTGFARTGAMFACEHDGIVPGPDHHRQGHRRRAAARRPSPAGPRSWTPPHAGGLGGTYGGNPVACAAALAALDAFEHGGLIERAQQIERDRVEPADARPRQPTRGSARSAAAAP